MTSEREPHTPGTAEPELPAPVPENEDAVTPDLPPSGPSAPDLWTSEDGEDSAEGGDGEDVREGDTTRPEADQPADQTAKSEDPEPQEPTD
ncbi:hypothetical protein ACFCYM_16650 [Streptomyces sp. NPDC056254]|uniref:hypothetical protein n=1 Tax=Streptomyces sp. NPDC056254 TaxID=3345763 RepID=UPI0035DC5DD8